MTFWKKLKNLFELDKPKCFHFKLYRLPHDVYICPECFRCWNASSMFMDRIALDDKEIEKLLILKRTQQKQEND